MVDVDSPFFIFRSQNIFIKSPYFLCMLYALYKFYFVLAGLFAKPHENLFLFRILEKKEWKG